MIAHLTGTLIAKTPDHCVIDVNGVGYHVSTSLTTFASLPDIGSASKLDIHTYVREDQILLFGFATPQEKALFQKLIAVSGIGPKTALAILSGLPTDHLIDAIGKEDVARISTIPGVGKKTAERIIVDLKDRLAKGMLISQASSSAVNHIWEDIVSALTNLGYNRTVAESALRKTSWSEETPLEEAIRNALRELCRV